MKLITFLIPLLPPRGTGQSDPAILYNNGFASLTSPDVGRLVFVFDDALANDEFVSAASLLRPVFEKPEDAVEVKFQEISRSTNGFTLELDKVEGETLTPYDSPLLCVVSVDV